MSNPIQPKKLHLSKWTATHPVNKEKHFLVTKVIVPEEPDQPIELIELQAVYSQRCEILPWRQLQDESRWRQGWH